ncbi:MAG TPA: hypothetical protein VKX16_00970 [Chloroflexota bacterium]|nr:hypothetical protein [Chloroflexota bacterium]
MQPIVKAAILCDYAMTSQDGKLSLVGIFSSMHLQSLPGAYPRFFVVFILALEAGQHDVQIGILDPAGQQMLPNPPSIPVHQTYPGADTNLVVDFSGLMFQRAGIHQIQLLVGGEYIHSIPLSVGVAPEQSEAVSRPN